MEAATSTARFFDWLGSRRLVAVRAQMMIV
jgi:hypothetical protein